MVSEVKLIQNIALEQAGVYYCAAKNPTGEDIRTVNIIVFRK